jgi:hypothetical protein
VADSLALDVPDEVLKEVRAFGRAVSTTTRDMTAGADVDWIAGDTVTARFDTQTTATAGRARRSARSWRGLGAGLTHHYDEERRGDPPSTTPAARGSPSRCAAAALTA